MSISSSAVSDTVPALYRPVVLSLECAKSCSCLTRSWSLAGPSFRTPLWLSRTHTSAICVCAGAVLVLSLEPSTSVRCMKSTAASFATSTTWRWSVYGRGCGGSAATDGEDGSTRRNMLETPQPISLAKLMPVSASSSVATFCSVTGDVSFKTRSLGSSTCVKALSRLADALEEILSRQSSLRQWGRKALANAHWRLETSPTASNPSPSFWSKKVSCELCIRFKLVVRSNHHKIV